MSDSKEVNNAYVQILEKSLYNAQNAIQEMFDDCRKQLERAFKDYREIESLFKQTEQDAENTRKQLKARDVLSAIATPLAQLYDTIYQMPESADSKKLIDCINNLNARLGNIGVTVKYHKPKNSRPHASENVKECPYSTDDLMLNDKVHSCTSLGFDINGDSPIQEDLVIYKYKSSQPSQVAEPKQEDRYPFKEGEDFIKEEMSLEEYGRRACILFKSDKMMNYFKDAYTRGSYIFIGWDYGVANKNTFNCSEKFDFFIPIISVNSVLTLQLRKRVLGGSKCVKVIELAKLNKK